MKTIRIDVTIHAKTALHAGIRNGNRELIIPGSQLKGILRHHLTQLFDTLNVTSDPLTMIFGSPQQVGALKFNHLSCVEYVAEMNDYRLSVAIDRKRRLPTENSLTIVETSANDGNITFSNSEAIWGYLPDDIAENYACWLLAAFQRISQIGGHKSRGLGWVDINVTAFCDDHQVKLNGLEVPQ